MKKIAHWMLECKRKFKIYEKKERGLILHLGIDL